MMKTFDLFVEEKKAMGDRYTRINHKAKQGEKPTEDFYVRPGMKVTFVHPNQSSVEPDQHVGRYVRRSRQDGKFLNIDDGTQLWRVHPNNIRSVTE